MRDKFSELIAAGVASFQEKPVGTPTPCLDPIVKLYNNVWGVLTDTHMSKTPEGYIITGTFVASPHWDSFKYCSFRGNTNIKLASGFYSLEHMVSSFGFQMVPDLYNGDNAIKLVPRTSPDPVVGGECDACCCPCAACCPVAYTTSESSNPHPLREVFTPEQEKALREAWEDAKGDAWKILEGIKSSRVLDESKFRISADNEYLIVGEQIKIKL